MGHDIQGTADHFPDLPMTPRIDAPVSRGPGFYRLEPSADTIRDGIPILEGTSSNARESGQRLHARDEFCVSECRVVGSREYLRLVDGRGWIRRPPGERSRIELIQESSVL